MSVQIGIIGGSGLYDMAELVDREDVTIEHAVRRSVRSRTSSARCADTGWRSSPGTALGHRLLPSELNFRANIYGFKTLGVEWILSASAVGSLKEAIAPHDIVIPDQFLDRTHGRISTFFGRQLVAHVAFAHPLCPALGRLAGDRGRAIGATVHAAATYVCMEGPQFSTLAESRLYRTWGAGRHRHDEPARRPSSRARRRSATRRSRSSPTTTAGTPTTTR